MVANPRRRAQVADAALGILGRDGGRGLTHRAVDRAAAVPVGTCVNYFPNRAALLLGVAERIFDRLAPSPVRLDDLATLDEVDALPQYVGYVVERLLADTDLARALIELRLEASRSPGVAAVVGPFLRDGLEADVEFHRSRGLEGDRSLVVVLHHLVNGVLLDALTVSLDPRRDPVEVAREATVHVVRGMRAAIH